MGGTRSGLVKGRPGQRRHTPGGLAFYTQHLAAGDEQMNLRAVAQQVFGEAGAGVDQMLTVVEDQQHALGLQVGEHDLQIGVARPFRQAKDLGHGLGDEGGVGQGRKIHQPHAICKVIGDLCADLQGEARLTYAAAAGERQQGAWTGRDP